MLLAAPAGYIGFEGQSQSSYQCYTNLVNILHIDPARRDLSRRFLGLPFRLYAHTPQWVPPMAFDAARMLDSRRNPFYQHSAAAFFLAEEGGRDVGRLAVLDNAHYNSYNATRTAFFYLFECEANPQAAHALFAAAGEWAKARGLTEIIGPKGFTALDGMGLLVRGFEHRPALGIPYNPPYYADLIAEAGFAPDGDTLSGRVDRNFQLSDKIHRAAQLVQKRIGLRVERFTSRAELRAFVPRLAGLYNAALEGTSGNTPLTPDEARSMAQQIIWFADPRLIKLIFKGDELAGFLFAYPDISAAIQRTGGRLWPLGWADLLTELRRTKCLNVNGMGVLPRFRGLGATALLFCELYDSVRAGGFEYADVVQIGAENVRMLNEIRGLEIDFNKTHRMFRRAC